MAAENNKSQSPESLRFSLRGLLCGITIAALCFATIAISANYFKRRDALKQADLARKAQLDRATVASIVKDVEAIRSQLGRAPFDQAELESLLGQPMPVVHDMGYPTPINYWQTGEDSFILQYELWATDDWIYDSKAPAAGWVQHWY